jgi:exosome complex RNA-binding protein Csl4
MTVELILAYAAFWLTLIQPLLVRSGVVPASCRRCGHHLERQELGGAVCSCH